MNAVLALLFACSTPAAPPPEPVWDHKVVRLLNETEGPMCTVIAIHGLGSTASRFSHVLDGYPDALQVVAPQAPDAHGKGFSWFPSIRTMTAADLAPAVDARVDALVNGLPALETEHPIAGKPIIMGFSQGGMFSFTAAARHPDAFRAAFPVGGFLPGHVKGDGGVVVHAFHGDEDTVIAHEMAKESILALKKAGYDADLTSFKGVGHQIPPMMRRNLYRAIGEACGGS